MDSVALIQAICDVLIAVATIALAVFARVYSLLQAEIEERNKARELLLQATKNVDNRFIALFSKRTFDNGTNLVGIRDVDYMEVMDPDRSYLESKLLVMRTALIQFLETLRSATSVAYDLLPVNAKPGAAPMKNKVWAGRFDPCTTNLRLAIQDLSYFWNTPTIGEPTLLETRRTFIRKIFGTDSEWEKFAKVAAVFVDNSTFGQRVDPKMAEATVEDEAAVAVAEGEEGV
jgi:hypothetical protein